MLACFDGHDLSLLCGLLLKIWDLKSIVTLVERSKSINLLLIIKIKGS